MTFKLQKKLLGFLIGLFLMIGNGACLAFAQISITVKNPNPYTGNQSWFVYQKFPGERIEDVATIKNFGKEAEKIKIYAVDATSNADGNFVLTFSGQKQHGIGTWTEIKEQELTLQPGQRVDVPFTISIPANVTPSEYVGGIIAESGSNDKDCNENACASSISVKTRVGSRIYITVPGTINDSIAWTDFRAEERTNGKIAFHFQIQNKGNVTYKPRTKIEIIDSFGHIFDTIEKTLGESLPNTSIESTILWDKENLPAMGSFSVQANVEFIKNFPTANELHGAPNQETKKLQFWLVPWKWLQLILLLTVSFFASLFISRRNFKKLVAHCREYEVQENENISSIADSYQMRWQKLAKINSLDAPYVLKKGQKILVPVRTDRNESATKQMVLPIDKMPPPNKN